MNDRNFSHIFHLLEMAGLRGNLELRQSMNGTCVYIFEGEFIHSHNESYSIREHGISREECLERTIIEVASVIKDLTKRGRYTRYDHERGYYYM